MTDIRNMPAGREMDALVAEKVMEWHRVKNWWVDASGDGRWIAAFDSEEYGDPFEPSTDIAAAWEVVEKIEELGGCVVISSPSRFMEHGKYWQVQVNLNGRAFMAKNVIAAAAISQAALLAIGEGA